MLIEFSLDISKNSEKNEIHLLCIILRACSWSLFIRLFNFLEQKVHI